jgi:hypothetical protein
MTTFMCMLVLCSVNEFGYCRSNPRKYPLAPEGMDWYAEDQAFSSSYDLAPHPTPPLPSVTRPATHRKTEKERHLLTREGGEGWGTYDSEKPSPLYLIQYSDWYWKLNYWYVGGGGGGRGGGERGINNTSAKKECLPSVGVSPIWNIDTIN